MTPVKCLFILAVLLIVHSQAHARIYKWVNENGETIYTEKLPPNARQGNIKEMKIPGSSLNNRNKVELEQDTQSSEQESGNKEDETEDSLIETEQAKKDAARKAEYQKKVAKHCSKLRENLAMLKSKSSLRRKNDAGQNVLIRNDARAAEIQQVQKQINQNCK